MAAVSVEQRSYIKIEYLRGKSGKEIYENLCEACGNNALSYDGTVNRPNKKKKKKKKRSWGGRHFNLKRLLPAF